MNLVRDLLRGAHSAEMLLFLYRRSAPATTNEIMAALAIRNWGTATGSLRRLQGAGLVVMTERKVGRYKSKAKIWTLEPRLGARVAAVLDQLDRLIETHEEPPGTPRGAQRPAIADVGAVGEKLRMAIHEVAGVTSRAGRKG